MRFGIDVGSELELKPHNRVRWHDSVGLVVAVRRPIQHRRPTSSRNSLSDHVLGSHSPGVLSASTPRPQLFGALGRRVPKHYRIRSLGFDQG